jgi:hypothetical protein
MAQQERRLLEDLAALEALGLITVETDDGDVRWWPTAKGRALGEAEGNPDGYFVVEREEDEIT